jgi:hypothetical protein
MIRCDSFSELPGIHLARGTSPYGVGTSWTVRCDGTSKFKRKKKRLEHGRGGGAADAVRAGEPDARAYAHGDA